MSLLCALALGAASTVALLGGSLAVLLPPLERCLEELCGSRERGRAWVALSGTALAGGVLLVALLAFAAGGPHEDAAGEQGFLRGVAMARAGAAALLCGIAVLCCVVASFTRRGHTGSRGSRRLAGERASRL